MRAPILNILICCEKYGEQFTVTYLRQSVTFYEQLMNSLPSFVVIKLKLQQVHIYCSSVLSQLEIIFPS